MNPRSIRKYDCRYEARRLEILRSAATAFSRRGFSAATMEDIAEALDMTKGNLYYYFRSKQELLYFCQCYSLDRLLHEARQILSREWGLSLVPVNSSEDEMGGGPADFAHHLLGSVVKRDNPNFIVRGLARSPTLVYTPPVLVVSRRTSSS